MIKKEDEVSIILEGYELATFNGIRMKRKCYFLDSKFIKNSHSEELLILFSNLTKEYIFVCSWHKDLIVNWDSSWEEYNGDI